MSYRIVLFQLMTVSFCMWLAIGCSDDSVTSSGRTDSIPSDNVPASTGCIDNQALPEYGTIKPYTIPAKIRTRIEPVYPRLALATGLEGTVTVSALVDRCGNVRDVILVQPSEHGCLDVAAEYAVRQWKFKAARYHGKPVPMWVDLTFEFILPF
jgi:protein TonB